MSLSRVGVVTLVQDEGQDGHSGTVAAGDSPCGNITVSPGKIVRCDPGSNFNIRKLQTQRDDGHGRKAGNGPGPGIDPDGQAAHEETGKGQVKHG